MMVRCNEEGGSLSHATNGCVALLGKDEHEAVRDRVPESSDRNQSSTPEAIGAASYGSSTLRVGKRVHAKTTVAKMIDSKKPTSSSKSILGKVVVDRIAHCHLYSSRAVQAPRKAPYEAVGRRDRCCRCES